MRVTIDPEEPSGDTPSVTPFGRASSLREGAGKRPHNVNHPSAGCFVSGRVIFGTLCGVCLPFIGVLAKPWGWRAIFIAPTKTQKFLHSTIHREALTQGGSRDGDVPSSRVLAKTWVAGDFHRPYKAQEWVHFTVLWASAFDLCSGECKNFTLLTHAERSNP